MMDFYSDRFVLVLSCGGIAMDTFGLDRHQNPTSSLCFAGRGIDARLPGAETARRTDGQVGGKEKLILMIITAYYDHLDLT